MAGAALHGAAVLLLTPSRLRSSAFSFAALSVLALLFTLIVHVHAQDLTLEASSWETGGSMPGVAGCPGIGVSYSSADNHTIQVVGGLPSADSEPFHVLTVGSSSWYSGINSNKRWYGFGQYYAQISEIPGPEWIDGQQWIYQIDNGGTTINRFSMFNRSSTAYSVNLGTSVGDYACLVAMRANWDDKLYNAVLGGIDDAGNYMNDMQIFQEEVAQAAGPALNVARGAAACMVSQHGDYVFVIGGVGTSEAKLASVEVLHINTGWNIDSWTLLTPTLVTGMSHMRAVVYGDDIVTVGGEDANGAVSWHNIIRHNQPHDVSTITISQSTPTVPLPALMCTAPVIHNGKLYTFGGFDSGGSETDAWYRLTLPLSAISRGARAE